MIQTKVNFTTDQVLPKTNPKILLVDDNEAVRRSLKQVLEYSGFEVVAAGGVQDALGFILSQEFDVLLSDLHMPNAGDGLTVVSAMRHSHPGAVTLLFSGYPEMEKATEAILLQTDEILTKPLAVEALVSTIRQRLTLGATPAQVVETVAEILRRETQSTIADWLSRVQQEKRISGIEMTDEQRSSHLPQLFRDLVTRLRSLLPLGKHALVSKAAEEHGTLRRNQGYTADMLVEESRMLQVSIFQSLQNNLHRVDFSLLLVGVMTIADEVDSQLAQTMASFISETDSVVLV